MQPIIPDHPRDTPPLPASGPPGRCAPSGGRLARLAALDPEQRRLALAFLSGYRPRVFDAILDAVEPPARPGTQDAVDQEPFCARCGAPVGIFLAHGKDYRHYRGVLTATSKPKPYKAGHAPVIAWRRAAA
jgi:ribosomal protein S27AE